MFSYANTYTSESPLLNIVKGVLSSQKLKTTEYEVDDPKVGVRVEWAPFRKFVVGRRLGWPHRREQDPRASNGIHHHQ